MAETLLRYIIAGQLKRDFGLIPGGNALVDVPGGNAIYASAGIFASSLTDNQAIAFIIAVLICFVMFMGFDSFAYLPGLKKIDQFVIGLGINEHYKSISRGVIDFRDVIYFISVSIIFNEATRLVLLSRKWKKGG